MRDWIGLALLTLTVLAVAVGLYFNKAGTLVGIPLDELPKLEAVLIGGAIVIALVIWATTMLGARSVSMFLWVLLLIGLLLGFLKKTGYI